MMPANHDPVNHPKHYTGHPSGVECIQITEHMNFCLGNAMKYIWRAGEKGLLTALAMVETLVAEIRVWVPATTKSPQNSSNLVIDDLIREARASQTVTAQSWVALVPVFVDLAREVFAVVNRTREAVKQDAEWTLAEEADFAVKLAALKTAEHWRP